MLLRKMSRYALILGIITWCVIVNQPIMPAKPANIPLASHILPLNDRYGNSFVNDVFKNNILLTLAYTTGNVRNKADIDWNKIGKEESYSLVLNPGEVFAFHDDILDAYKNKALLTTNAHFSSTEGFLSDGYLYGDGVCHLASLINWTAKDAGLSVEAPTLHSFANIPDVPAKYGVSIYAAANQKGTNQRQNLYIENKFNEPVVFAFAYTKGDLQLTIAKTRRTFQ